MRSAAVALTLPYERPLNDGFRTPDGRATRFQATELIYATPGYFEALRIPLLAGRGILDSDTADATSIAVVSESFAKKYFEAGDAVGRHVQIEGATRQIAGVVGDVEQHSGIGDFGPINLEPTVYVPAAQLSGGFFQVIHRWFSPRWVVRATGSPADLVVRIESAIRSVDPQLPVAEFHSIDDLRAGITGRQRYQASLFSLLAGLAVVLAAVGLYGLISQSVTERTREMGVRMALGANVRDAISSILKPALRLAAAGVAAGFCLSLATVHLLRHLVWGVRPTDPLTFAATAAFLVAVAVLASLLPALRLLHLDPAQALRDE